jgi:hypothetical protein
MPALTPQQRRLVEIFIWYLRALPNWTDADSKCGTGGSWNSAEYDIVNGLLCRFFRDKNPGWVLSGEKYYIGDLPEADCAEYEELMRHASCPEDPRIQRRRDLLELGRTKRGVINHIKFYEDERRKLGLSPDITLQAKPATQLEQAAAEQWGSIGLAPR